MRTVNRACQRGKRETADMVRDIFRRIDQLEARAMATTRGPIDKSTTSVPATRAARHRAWAQERSEEVERVRACLERRRAARLLWKGVATDTHDRASA
jgi:hypothetical protein